MEKNHINEDISLAQRIVSRSFFNNGSPFSDCSRIYRCTNERIKAIPYIDTLKNKNRILSVIGSGDQIINSILFGSTDISGFDISRFPKYYLMLKLAAIVSLSKHDYLEFFSGSLNDNLLSEELYEEIRNNLSEESLLFWDSLYDYYDSCEINESCLFSSEITNKQLMLANNPYLDGDNFDIVKRKLKDGNISLTLYNGNIFKFFDNIDIGSFSLINLSNIIQYSDKSLGNNWEQVYYNYKSFIEMLPLDNDGVALTYYFNLNREFLNKYFSDSNYSIVSNGEDTKSGLLLYRKG
jgi:hypothetical protein